MPSLETRDLGIRFGGHAAVDGVSCTFRPGTLTAIVGPNGAGKTTFFDLISGQLRPNTGRILWDGGDVTALPPSARAQRGIGRAFQLTNLFPGLTVRENLRLGVQARAGGALDLFRLASRRRDVEAETDGLLERIALARQGTARAGTLSHGDQRKLEVGLMLALRPRLFLFDEPTAGMSLDDVPVVLDLIAAIKADREATILLVEHKMDVVKRLADRIVVLDRGSLVADGEPDDVIASPAVQRAYLGLADA